MSKIILLHFGAFVPGIQQPAKPSADETDEGDGSDPASDSHMTDGCKGKILIFLVTIYDIYKNIIYIYDLIVAQYFSGYDCRKRCVGSADVSWPQSVGSGILKVHGTLVKYYP